MPSSAERLDAVVGGIGDPHPPRGAIDGDAAGSVELAVARVRRGVARVGRDVARLPQVRAVGAEALDAMVERVRDVDRPGGVDGDALGARDVAGAAAGDAPGRGGRAVRGEGLHAVVRRVGDGDAARRVVGHRGERAREPEVADLGAELAPRALEGEAREVEGLHAVVVVVGHVELARLARVDADVVGEAELRGADPVGAELANVGAVGQELDDAVVVVVGHEHVAGAGVDGDALGEVEAVVVERVRARARRAVAVQAPDRGGRGHVDDVARPAGGQHRVARIARRAALEPEGLDAVVVLIGDVGHRHVGRGRLRDGDPARARVVAQAQLPGTLARAPPRRQPLARGRREDLDAIVLGVQHVDVAGAIGGQAAHDADAPELAGVGVAAELAQPCARAVEALDDRAVLVGDEDRARARAVGDGLREAQHARSRRGRLAQGRGLHVALGPGAGAGVGSPDGDGDCGDDGDGRALGHARAVPVSRPRPPRRPRCTGSMPRRASRRPLADRPPGPARCADALAQPAQAVAGPVAGQGLRVARAVVDHLDVDRAGAAADEHVHRCPGGVAQRVGQALAHDPIDGLDRRCRQPLARALEPQGDVEAGPGRPRDQLLDEREVGRVPDRVVVGQQRHQLGHVALGLPRGAGDGVERLARQFRVDRRDALAGPGLHDHHADRVRDDVVQLEAIRARS